MAVLLLLALIQDEPLKLEGHTGTVTAIAVSPDGRTIATGSKDKTVRLWDAKKGTLKHTLKGHDDTVTCLAWLRNATIISGSLDKTVRLWNAKDGVVERTIKGHHGEIQTLRLSQNRQTLVSGGALEVIYWNLRNGKERKRIDVIGLPSSNAKPKIVDTRVSPDLKYVYWGQETGTIDQADTRTVARITTFMGSRNMRCIALDPEGKLLASGAQGFIRIYDVEGQKELHRIETGTDRLAFAREGALLVCASEKKIEIRDVKTGKVTHTLEHPDGRVSSLATDKKGRWLLAGCEADSVRVFALPDP